MSKSALETINYNKILVDNLDPLAEQVGLAFNPMTYKKMDYEGTKTILKKYLDSKDPSNGSSTITYTFSKLERGNSQILTNKMIINYSKVPFLFY